MWKLPVHVRGYIHVCHFVFIFSHPRCMEDRFNISVFKPNFNWMLLWNYGLTTWGNISYPLDIRLSEHNYYVLSDVTSLLSVMRVTLAFKFCLWWFKWSHFSQASTYDYIFFALLFFRFVCSGCFRIDMNVARFTYKRLSFISLHHSQSFSFSCAIYFCLSLSLPLSCYCQVHLLRTAGDEVTINVRYLREVPSFLKLPLGKSRVVLMACKLTIIFI